MYFLETSAKEAENVERLFYEIAAELRDQARSKDASVSNQQRNNTSDSIGLSSLSAKANYFSQNNCCTGGASN